MLLQTNSTCLCMAPTNQLRTSDDVMLTLYAVIYSYLCYKRSRKKTILVLHQILVIDASTSLDLPSRTIYHIMYQNVTMQRHIFILIMCIAQCH